MVFLFCLASPGAAPRAERGTLLLGCGVGEAGKGIQEWQNGGVVCISLPCPSFHLLGQKQEETGNANGDAEVEIHAVKASSSFLPPRPVTVLGLSVWGGCAGLRSSWVTIGRLTRASWDPEFWVARSPTLHP